MYTLHIRRVLAAKTRCQWIASFPAPKEHQMLCDSIMQLGSGHACLVCSSPCDTELVYRVDAHHRPRGVAWQVRTSPLRTYEVQQSALSVEGRLVASLFSLLELSSPAVLRAVRRFVGALRLYRSQPGGSWNDSLQFCSRRVHDLCGMAHSPQLALLGN